ncbi:MAG TPA: CHAD domain-containing protein [Pyrinomonadaceae bacterium]
MAKAREIAALECDGDGVEGIRRVLLVRLDEVCEFREQALDFSDIKGVHAMRVASRRLRSASRDFAPYLRKGRLDGAVEELRELADLLGGVRDLDVELSALEKLSDEVPPGLAEGVREIVGEREARRERARARLAEDMTAGAVEDLRRKFARAVEDASRARRRSRKNDDGDATDGPSFRAVGREVSLRLWDELSARSRSLRRPLKSGPLHRMRISAKRLRYALELFAQSHGETLKGFAEEIAEMQGSLGNLHDCDVWVETFGDQLREYADAADSSGDADHARRRDAAVWLLGHFAEKRTRHYRDALDRWHEWQRSDFAARLAACLEE